MCLLLVAYRAHPDVELLLAGNRDEFYRRQAKPPGLIYRQPRIFAGQDLEAGGTWMGENEHGLVAALTNRRVAGAAAPPEARSRGEIVLGLLRHAAPGEAASWLERLPHAQFRPYSVLFGNRERFYFFSPQDGALLRPLEPGFYSLSNSTLNDRTWPKVERALEFLERHRAQPGTRLLEDLQRFLCDATPAAGAPSLDLAEELRGATGAVFIRTQAYGTVSSSIITLGGKLGSRYYFAERQAMQEADAGWRGGGAGPGPFRLLETELQAHPVT